ncbi:unnamed protein product [Rotaria sp. Silwood1]|nr:unnamed protein product [Rotaria sp. Silwood1]CAF4966345.1 unnamed protein product [Rotaria sp. Silwood1]
MAYVLILLDHLPVAVRLVIDSTMKHVLGSCFTKENEINILDSLSSEYIDEYIEPDFIGAFLRRCSDACRDLNYGYGCKQSCECVHGKYNGNTTHANESCTCDPRYQPPLSFQLIDQCAINSPCNNATEDRALDPNNCITICACQLGDERPNTTTICIGMSNQ